MATLPGAWRYRVSTGTGGPVSVYCDWVRWKVWSVTSISLWQHVKLSVQIRPWDTLACCLDIKQPTNQQTIRHFPVWVRTCWPNPRPRPEKMRLTTQWNWVKLFTDGCLRRLSMLVGGKENRRQESRSRGLSLCFSERFVSLCFSERFVSVFRNGLCLFFGAVCVCFSERLVSVFRNGLCLFVFR